MLPLFDTLTTPRHLHNFSPTCPSRQLAKLYVYLANLYAGKTQYHNHTEITITQKLQLHKIKVTDTSHRSRYV